MYLLIAFMVTTGDSNLILISEVSFFNFAYGGFGIAIGLCISGGTLVVASRMMCGGGLSESRKVSSVKSMFGVFAKVVKVRALSPNTS